MYPFWMRDWLVTVSVWTVGVDNMFILAHALDSVLQEKSATTDDAHLDSVPDYGLRPDGPPSILFLLGIVSSIAWQSGTFQL